MDKDALVKAIMTSILLAFVLIGIGVLSIGIIRLIESLGVSTVVEYGLRAFSALFFSTIVFYVVYRFNS